jgi:glycosyltransferase involved in cell wall biosynthesis
MDAEHELLAAGSPLRVLMVAARFTPFVGGTETHTLEVASRMVDMGHSVTVLTTDPTRDLPPKGEINGITIIRVPAYPANRDYYFAPGIYRTIMSGTWDLVHCQGYHSLACPTAMLAALRARIPYVVSFHSGGHSSGLRVALRGVQRRLLRPLLARADRLVAVSRFETELFGTFLDIPQSKFTVIPNGSNLTVPTGVPSAFRSANHEPLILSIGRLESYKGHQRVIRAMPHLLKTLNDAQLMVVGSGPYQSELMRLIDQLGLSERVSIRSIPSTERDQMAQLISSASLVTLLSDYEAHPVSVVEALALNRPVLVAYAAGCAELADEGFVRAIALESSDAEVAEVMRQQIEHPFVPQSISIPSWEGCVSELLSVYRAVVRPGTSGGDFILESSGIT